MANSKISALPAASTPLAGTELVPIVQGGITERVSIDNLTAGKTVPTGKLQASSTGEVISGTTSGDVTTTGTNFWRFYDSGGAKGYIGYGGSAGRFDVNSGLSCNMNINATNGTMELATGNITQVTIVNSGDATVVNGNLVIGTSGKGIDFSATSGSGTSELLNDYEVGTWTPTVTPNSGSITTLGTLQGYYTKVGNQVTLWASVEVVNNGTGAGFIYLGNMPFIPASSTLGGNGYIGAGYNTSSGLMLCARATSGGVINITKYDGTYPLASANSVTICVTFFV